MSVPETSWAPFLFLLKMLLLENFVSYWAVLSDRGGHPVNRLIRVTPELAEWCT